MDARFELSVDPQSYDNRKEVIKMTCEGLVRPHRYDIADNTETRVRTRI